MPKFNFEKDIDDMIAADWAKAKPHAKVPPTPFSSSLLLSSLELSDTKVYEP